MMISTSRSPEPAAGPPAIVIRDDGRVAHVAPAPREVLEELLVGRQRFVVDDRGRLRREAEAEHLFDLDPAGGVNVLSGLVPRVAAAARRAGYRVEVRDDSEPVIPASPPADAEVDPDRRRLAAALAAGRAGVVLAGSRAARLAVVGLAIKLFAPGRVMVVTKTRAEAREVCRALRAGCGEPVACSTRQYTRSDVRIQVGTAGGLDLSAARVVIFTDATQVLHERVRLQLRVLRRQRLLGLLDDRRDLSRRERLVIEGELGPVIGRLGPTDDRPAAVAAVFADWRSGERPDLPVGLDWKRASIWSNPERNAALARLAAALGGGGIETLYGFALFLDEEPAARLPDNRRVAVLVESPEHARALGRLLPGWAVLTAGPGGAGEAAGADRSGRPDRAIMTLLYADGAGGPDADVVIRADGTPWPLDLPPRAGGAGEAGGRPVLLVDLADHQDATARDATRRRWRDYRDRGWIAAGAPCPAPAGLAGGPP